MKLSRSGLEVKESITVGVLMVRAIWQWKDVVSSLSLELSDEQELHHSSQGRELARQP